MHKSLIPLLLLVAASACSTETFEIAPSWSVGDVRTIVFVIDRESQMEIGSSPSFTGASRSEIWIDYEVREIVDGAQTSLSFTFQRAELSETVTANGNTSVPFGGEDSISPLQKMYAALKGQTFDATIDTPGSVVSIDGIDSIVEYLKKSAPATGDISNSTELTQDQLDELTQSFAESFDASSTTGLLETVFHVYPRHRVKVGETWRTESKGAFMVSTGGSVTDWTLESADNGMLNVSFAVESDDSAGEFGEITVGSGSGTATFDQSTGMLIELQATIKTTMDNSVDGVTVHDESVQNIKVEMFE